MMPDYEYNGSINGVQNNSSVTSSPGMWSINDVQKNSTDANWAGDATGGVFLNTLL